MGDNSIERFIECLEHSELIAKDELARALAAWKHADPAVFEASQRLADKFVEAKLLTPWQATNFSWERARASSSAHTAAGDPWHRPIVVGLTRRTHTDAVPYR